MDGAEPKVLMMVLSQVLMMVCGCFVHTQCDGFRRELDKVVLANLYSTMKVPCKAACSHVHTHVTRLAPTAHTHTHTQR